MNNEFSRRVWQSIIIYIASCFAATLANAQPIQEMDFGQTLENWPVHQFILTNSKGVFRPDHRLRRDRHQPLRPRQKRQTR